MSKGRGVFGGRSLKEFTGKKDDNKTGEGTSADSSDAVAQLSSRRTPFPAADLAKQGHSTVQGDRTTTFMVDPKRCRGWKHYNRKGPSWYTRERCADLIESIPRDGQQVEALARQLSDDPDYDYELIYGMRRRFACEYSGQRLKIKLTRANDQECAVLMHLENKNREDITPMERAISFVEELKDGTFPTQDELSAKLGIPKGTLSKMLKAASIFDHSLIARLFPDTSLVPVDGAYKLAGLLAEAKSREVMLKSAEAAHREELSKTQLPPALLRWLLDSPNRSTRVGVLNQDFNLGIKGRVTVKRNAKGKVTMTLPQGLAESSKEEFLESMGKAFDELLGR